MSADIKQVYDANPTTGTIPETALTYLGLFPFDDTNDSAATWGTVLNNIGLYNSSNTLLSRRTDGGFYFAPSGTFNGAYDVSLSLAHFQNYLAGGQTYNNDLSLSASQSGTTVTGTGTAFNTNMQGGLIYWPLSGNIQQITTVSSSTSLTVTASHAQVNAPFIIYFPGYIYNPLTGVFTIPKLSATSIDSYAPYTTLTIGQTNATLVQIGSIGGLTYFGESSYAGLVYNQNLSLSASQALSVVTGSGTSFSNDMTNGKIFWPSTGQMANIITVNSTTQLTVDESQTQANAPFIIYFGGIGVSPSQVAVSPLIPFLVNQIDTDATYKVLQIGSVNADYMLINCGIGYLPNFQNTSPYTCVLRDNTILFSFASGGTINLYANPYPGMFVSVKDILGNATTNPTTINGNGKNIDGAATFSINSNRAAAGFLYGGTEWCVM